MLFELIAAVSAGFAAGGLVLLINWATGGALPRFALPAAAGLAMLAFAVWSEYSWFERQRVGLPEGFSILSSHAEPSIFRPWTYVAPFANRFTAVNLGSQRRNPAAPGQILADLYRFQRYMPPSKTPVLVDCPQGRSAPIIGDVGFTEDGRIDGAVWHPLPKDAPLYAALCGGP